MKATYTSIFLLVVLGLASCQKNYESVPLGQTAVSNDVFNPYDSAGTNAIYYLANCYLQSLVSGHNRIGNDYLDAASDDAVSSSNTLSLVQEIATGQFSAAAPNGDDVWTRDYTAIRDNTIFINNIYIVPINAKLPDGRPMIAAYRSEARFLRAYLYLDLVKRYGGVPLLGDTVFTITDNAQVPRNSFSDCINYIVSECDDIKDSLRTAAQVNGNTYGHFTEGAAYALKAQALLLAASPLYNGGNIDPNNPLTGYTNYDVNRWNLAAQAAQAVVNLNTYQLVQNFPDAFTTQASPVGTNTETISWIQVGATEKVETMNSPVGYTSQGATGQTSPTQNLVASYPMINGLPITDPASGFNALDPYDNRDPRLTKTVFCNGDDWLDRQVETFDGGLDKPGGIVQQTKTGYYMRKFMGPFESVQGNPPEFSNTIHDWILARYSEILLDLAEATNEYSGPSAAVYNILTQIRNRAGISPGADNMYGLATGMNQEEMRTAIQLERRLELAFEEHRYWDIRRWKIAESVYNTAPLQGLDLVQTSNGLINYNPINVLTTSFVAPRMYFYPIPYTEVVKNPQMTQNPGW